MAKPRRYKPSIRRDIILKAAVELAKQPGGYSSLTRVRIAEAADCSEGLVSRYLKDMHSCKRTIVRFAIKNDLFEIISQSVAAHDGFVTDNAIKRKALAALLGA